MVPAHGIRHTKTTITAKAERSSRLRNSTRWEMKVSCCSDIASADLLLVVRVETELQLRRVVRLGRHCLAADRRGRSIVRYLARRRRGVPRLDRLVERRLHRAQFLVDGGFHRPRRLLHFRLQLA